MSIDNELDATPRLKEAINNANSPEELKGILDAAVESVDSPVRTRTASQRVEAADEPTVYTRTEIIGGKSFTFDAESELELERAVSNAYKVAEQFAHPVATEPVVNQDEAQQREILRRSEIEMQFKRGEISASQYLEQSGAVREYLESQGVPIEELKANVDESRGRGFEQSWADATQEFLNSAAGSTWPGGNRNLAIIGNTIAALGLVDAEDKGQALREAYQHMKDSQTLFPYEPEAAEAPAPVTTTKRASRSSSMFGTSTGGGSRAGASRAVRHEPAGSTLQITDSMSPVEILEAYKAGLAGQDPSTANAAFIEHFAKH